MYQSVRDSTKKN